MANTTTNLVSLDFATIKQSLITFLQSQAIFNDYNFDGSNISVLLDLLSYNDKNIAFFVNMLGAEMFLDSAQIQDSVVSHAKELNYTPRSNQSAVINTDIVINTGNSSLTSFLIPQYQSFTGRIGSNSYNFTVNSAITALGTNNIVTAANVSLYEGEIVGESFIFNAANTIQRFVLSNPNIDITSISLTDIENNGNTFVYLPARSLFGLTANSQVYFVQGAENGQYEIIFGDNIIGRTPADGATLNVIYRVSHGSDPNGISTLITNGPISGFTNIAFNINTTSQNGANAESIESIRYNAPRAFNTQERAIATDDYESLLLQNFPEIRAVICYGGDQLVPPQYGKAFISVELNGVDGIPASKVIDYQNFLKERNSLTITPFVISPNFLFVAVKTLIKYNINITQLDSQSIASFVANTISSYNDNFLNNFNVTLYYSPFGTLLDNSDPSIISNETQLTMINYLTPIAGIAQNFSFTFGQPLQSDLPPQDIVHPASQLSVVSSNQFLLNGMVVVIEDDSDGNINLMQVIQNTHNKIQTIGSVDYTQGACQIKNLKPDTSNIIKIYGIPQDNDIFVKQNVILKIQPQDVNITVDAVKI